MQNHQNNQVATSTHVAVPQDETKTMLQKLLQGQQLQGKALNQVTTGINTRMNHMFGDLSTKYDNVASHMRQMDIQIAQTAESVKRQQGTLPGKTDKNSKECNAVQLRSGKQLSEPEKRSSPGPEQPNEAVCPIPEAVPPREYIPKVPYPVPARATHDALHAQLYEGIDLRKNIRGERVHDGFQGVQRMRAEAEQSVVNIDADGYAKMLDSARSMGRMGSIATQRLNFVSSPVALARTWLLRSEQTACMRGNYATVELG
ncbi:hypothetical protein DY000_02008752 [Brassica cretica]|uniref:Uncharacterized protein n=1 Tax=Brassica cretica TaxID=69181 RepID=A0ABQ7BS52_BRACR|nr:hypothetical protein DY000_02008752 [Brassica cretica]